jgi:hypothetical protein
MIWQLNIYDISKSTIPIPITITANPEGPKALILTNKGAKSIFKNSAN